MREDLDEKFKADDDPLRLVFVCAMWITGFDVPTCSTMYLDKPMKNHTLMQTIARANRVAPGKEAGLIVDYVGVFRNLKDALAIYARPRLGVDDLPIKDKAALVAEFTTALVKAAVWAQTRGVDVEAIINAEGFQRQARIQEAAEAVLGRDDEKRSLCALVPRHGSSSSPSYPTLPHLSIDGPWWRCRSSLKRCEPLASRNRRTSPLRFRRSSS
jgi:type I restriction enzyme, R subunit